MNTNQPQKILLMGYNGKNNTGSEARLLSIIEDVRAVFGPDVQITVPTLNDDNLRRYLKEGPTIRIVKVPTIYHFAIRRLARESDLVLLTEGSCYMDTWGSPLLKAFLWTTKSAERAKKPILAYAVDSGKLSNANCRRVKRDASLTTLIVTRTKSAADRLKSCGVTAPIKVTEDAAFTFKTNPQDENVLQQEWPEATSSIVGIAVVNFHLWPVVARPFGRRSRCYQWPYYFSDSSKRRRLAKDLASSIAAEADRIVEKHGKKIALMVMESVDDSFAEKVYSAMKYRDKARIFSASKYNASQMTSILKSLDLLITSRYHASVLSMRGGVPQIAIGHDIRLKDIYKDLGMSDLFFHYEAPELWKKVDETVDRIIADPMPYRNQVTWGHNHSLKEALWNQSILRDFARDQGWAVDGQTKMTLPKGIVKYSGTETAKLPLAH